MYKCLQFPKDISDVIPKEFETFHFTHAGHVEFFNSGLHCRVYYCL